jgi:Helix-turn-helix domain
MRFGTSPAPAPQPQPPAATPMFEPLLDDTQAGQLLHMDVKMLQRMARLGEIPAIRIGRFWFYRESQLDAWVVLHSTSQKNPPAHNRKETI